MQQISWVIPREHSVDLYDEELEEYFENNDDEFYEKHPRSIAANFINDCTDECWQDIPNEIQARFKAYIANHYRAWKNKQEHTPQQLSLFDHDYN